MSSYKPAALRPEDEIPILDLGPYLAGEAGALDRVAKQLYAASTEVGFYYIKNHGIPDAVVYQAFRESERFHALPAEEKLKLAVDKHKIGYIGVKDSLVGLSPLGRGAPPDLYAIFALREDLSPDHPAVLAGRPYRSPNQWPAELPHFRENVMAYMNGVEKVAHSLLPVLARALNMPADFFEPIFANPLLNLQLNYYPDQPQFDGKQFGLAPHTDRGFITILCQEEKPGLEIGTRDGRWVQAPVLPGHLLVNTGDLLRYWTNDVFLSTPHRVINVSRGDRHSIPFFYKPDTDVVVNCIPSCQSSERPAKYPATTVLDFYEAFVKASFPTVEAERAKAAALAR